LGSDPFWSSKLQHIVSRAPFLDTLDLKPLHSHPSSCAQGLSQCCSQSIQCSVPRCGMVCLACTPRPLFASTKPETRLSEAFCQALLSLMTMIMCATVVQPQRRSFEGPHCFCMWLHLGKGGGCVLQGVHPMMEGISLTQLQTSARP